MRKILLVDNGSLRAQATLNLRRLAHALGQATGQEVEAASLLHSYKIPAEELEGRKAVSLGPLAGQLAAQGTTELVVLPFFFGPSQAMTRYLPERLAEVQANYPQLSVKVALPLVDSDTHVFVDLRDGVEQAKTGVIPGAIASSRGMMEFHIDPESPAHKP
ncbi:MAG: CbiX/SirB N-terminal domain-containing protein, partial [Halomonas sp.]